MKIRPIRWFALFGAGLLFLSMVSCGFYQEHTVKSENDPKAESVAADSIINGRAFCFVDEETKTQWKEPLAKLLSNILIPQGDDGDISGYEPSVDPNAPAIVQSYACGLLDVTLDGVPELFVHPFGYYGSSGTSTYFVYDIYSGQKLGEIDGGNDQSWCLYYNTRSDELNLIGRYWLRGGWAWRDRLITEVHYDELTEECREMLLFHTAHTIEGEQIEIADDDSGTKTGFELYPSTTYYVKDQKVNFDDYYTEYDRFTLTQIRIPETELILFRWGEVSDNEDDYTVRGEKMAEALVSSKQEFIRTGVADER